MNILVLVLLLSIVAIGPRILPVLFVGKFELNEKVETFLNYIPIAALGVLIFPGILDAVETPTEGILGGIFAGVLGWFKVPLFFIVVFSILFIYSLMIFI